VLNREPLQVLVLLIEHSAEEVPREQIQKELWCGDPGDTQRRRVASAGGLGFFQIDSA
jgi:hypothetical protein